MAGTLVISGIIQGCIYALIGVGLVVVYKASRIVNFAQGGMAVLLTYVAYGSLRAGMPYALAIVVSLVAAVVVGTALERGPVRMLSGHHVLTALIGTYGFGLVCEGVASLVWGTGVLSFRPPTTATVGRLYGTYISGDDVVIVGVTAGVVALLAAFFRFTSMGAAMRAVSNDPEAAELVGISTRKVSILSWSIGAALAALSGILVSPTLNLTPSQLDTVMIASFGAIILGGFTSIAGVVIAGIGLGVAESLFQGYVSSSLPNTFLFAVILVVLLTRPYGLFGEAESMEVRETVLE